MANVSSRSVLCARICLDAVLTLTTVLHYLGEFMPTTRKF
jgi:hypothetical protein